MSERKEKILLWLLPKLVAILMRVWFATCRVRLHRPENFVQPGEEESRPQLASFWHYSILFVLYQMRHYRATAMVSASRDGEYLARLASELGYDIARGSSHQKGVAALKGLLKAVKKGRSCALVADGSRGPALEVQPGVLLLSARSGDPIVPIVWSASRYFTIHSWDRMAFPLPFSRVEFFFGEPLVVPPNVKGDELEKWRLELESRLLSLYAEAWNIFDKSKHYE